MRFSLMLAVFLTLILSFDGHSSELFSDKITVFEIKPQVCIVNKIGEQCRLQTTVHWQTKEAMAVCLMQQEKVVQCWKDKQSIREKLAIFLHRSTEVLLVDQHQDKLASELLEVNALNRKKQRRRLRSAWSLF